MEQKQKSYFLFQKKVSVDSRFGMVCCGLQCDEVGIDELSSDG